MRSVPSALRLVALATLASACVTANGASRSSKLESTPTPKRQTAAQARDSIFAQAFADREGPGASIQAQFTGVAGSRRVRASFHVDQDAYVVVGHIDADGVLRIAFPGEPGDDGFVKGEKSYQTQEFFAGFNDQYQYRVRSNPYSYAAARSDSYDGGLGYVFMIAAWRPMRYDRFQTDGKWDTFEISDVDYLKDPRPAIYELAALLAGENREAYTVKFARYYNTMPLYADYGSGGASGYGLCSGLSAGLTNFGLGSSPFDPGSMYANYYGSSFDYRGTPYYYNAFGNCYNTGFPTLGYQGGYRIAGLPIVPANPAGPHRGFNAEDQKRNPLEPRPNGGRGFPGRIVVENRSGETTPRSSPGYRERGLIAFDDPGSVGRREPRAGSGGDSHRPSIQDMVNRPTGTTDGWSRGQGVGGRSTETGFPGFGSDIGSMRSAGGFSGTATSTGFGGSSASAGSTGTSGSSGSSGGSAPPASSGGSSGGRPPQR